MSEDPQSEIAPALQNRVELSPEQIGGTRDVLARLSQGLDALPVILSQDGDVVSYGGPIEAETAGRLAGEFARAASEEKEALLAELEFEKWLVEACLDALPEGFQGSV